MTYQSIHPNDGKLLKCFEHMSAAELEKSLATAETCFQAWKHKSYAERAESFLAPLQLHPKEGEAHMESSPLGVLFCIESWNFPYYQLARVAGPQLIVGNVPVVKHAGCVPQCAIAFEKLLRDAGAPAGAYTNLRISYDQSNLWNWAAATPLSHWPTIPTLAWAAPYGRKTKRVASRVDTGMVFVNNINWTDAELPFGGIKGSGDGRELGNMGIHEFVNKKLVRSGHFAVLA